MLLFALTGCTTHNSAEDAMSPDTVACKQLLDIDRRVLDLYNETQDSAQRTVYLQELGEQAVNNVRKSILISGLSDGMRDSVAELEGLFLKPIIEYSGGDNGLASVEETVVGYEPVSFFSHDKIATYFAKVTLLCT